VNSTFNNRKETLVTLVTGKVSNKDQKMEMNITMSYGIPEIPKVPVPTKIQKHVYLIGNTIYTMEDAGVYGVQWTKEDVEADYWDTHNQLKQQIELLKVSDVKLI